MSEARQQAYIEAPVEVVWELLEDVVDKFKEFLDNVSPEDFAGGSSS